MQKFIEHKALRCLTEKEALWALTKGYALATVEKPDAYLTIHNDKLMIVEQNTEGLLIYEKCHSFDITLLVSQGCKIYELKEIPWYENAPIGKPIICYPLIDEDMPDKTKVALLVLNNWNKDSNCDENGKYLDHYRPVPKDELLSYLYLYK